MGDRVGHSAGDAAPVDRRLTASSNPQILEEILRLNMGHRFPGSVQRKQTENSDSAAVERKPTGTSDDSLNRMLRIARFHLLQPSPSGSEALMSLDLGVEDMGFQEGLSSQQCLLDPRADTVSELESSEFGTLVKELKQCFAGEKGGPSSESSVSRKLSTYSLTASLDGIPELRQLSLGPENLDPAADVVSRAHWRPPLSTQSGGEVALACMTAIRQSENIPGNSQGLGFQEKLSTRSMQSTHLPGSLQNNGHMHVWPCPDATVATTHSNADNGGMEEDHMGQQLQCTSPRHITAALGQVQLSEGEHYPDPPELYAISNQSPQEISLIRPKQVHGGCGNGGEWCAALQYPEAQDETMETGAARVSMPCCAMERSTVVNGCKTPDSIVVTAQGVQDSTADTMCPVPSLQQVRSACDGMYESHPLEDDAINEDFSGHQEYSSCVHQLQEEQSVDVHGSFCNGTRFASDNDTSQHGCSAFQPLLYQQTPSQSVEMMTSGRMDGKDAVGKMKIQTSLADHYVGSMGHGNPPWNLPGSFPMDMPTSYTSDTHNPYSYDDGNGSTPVQESVQLHSPGLKAAFPEQFQHHRQLQSPSAFGQGVTRRIVTIVDEIICPDDTQVLPQGQLVYPPYDSEVTGAMHEQHVNPRPSVLKSTSFDNPPTTRSCGVEPQLSCYPGHTILESSVVRPPNVQTVVRTSCSFMIDGTLDPMGHHRQDAGHQFDMTQGQSFLEKSLISPSKQASRHEKYISIAQQEVESGQQQCYLERYAKPVLVENNSVNRPQALSTTSTTVLSPRKVKRKNTEGERVPVRACLPQSQEGTSKSPGQSHGEEGHVTNVPQEEGEHNQGGEDDEGELCDIEALLKATIASKTPCEPPPLPPGDKKFEEILSSLDLGLRIQRADTKWQEHNGEMKMLEKKIKNGELGLKEGQEAMRKAYNRREAAASRSRREAQLAEIVQEKRKLEKMELWLRQYLLHESEFHHRGSHDVRRTVSAGPQGYQTNGSGAQTPMASDAQKGLNIGADGSHQETKECESEL